ncbi:hypothetical protein ACFQ3S_19220 [Mucilaginibacter terrae]|uniref:hypothetical protein n=1 Tax=Mucilaginibacter terrae TaxID=1955052 RepID=UPI0036327C88
MKKIFTLLFAAGLLSSCGSGGSSSGSKGDSTAADTSTATETTTDTKKESSANETKWSYEEKVDKMTSEKTRFATIDSDNQLQFEFPYDGGSTATLLIRKNGKSNEVLLSISKGQFNTTSDGASVKVRFDDNKASTFSCSTSSDGSSDLLFINNENKFITKLKKAKKLIIQAEFYEAGLKEMEFSTAGLKWDL